MEKWGWCTSWAAGGGTQGPSSPVSCQWLLEKHLHPKAPTTDLLIRRASFCPLYLPTLSLWHSQGENLFNQTFPWVFSSDGQHQVNSKSNRKTSHWFTAVRNQMSGYQIWTHPCICMCQFRLCAMSQKQSPELRAPAAGGEAGMAEQSRHELSFVQLVLSGRTGYRRHKGEGAQPQRCQALTVTFHRGTPWLCDQLSVQLKGQALLKVFSLPSSNVHLCWGILRNFTRFPAFQRNLLQTSTELWKTILMI